MELVGADKEHLRNRWDLDVDSPFFHFSLIQPPRLEPRHDRGTRDGAGYGLSWDKPDDGGYGVQLPYARTLRSRFTHNHPNDWDQRRDLASLTPDECLANRLANY